jgi:dienelactone hydrolase
VRFTKVGELILMLTVSAMFDDSYYYTNYHEFSIISSTHSLLASSPYLFVLQVKPLCQQISPLVTGPVARFARQIASHGYIVAAPSSYHEFVGPEALAYDVPGTDLGNDLKIKKKISAYDEDATLTIDHLLSMPTCTGRIGATGMCLGGHLAYRAALDPRVNASVCYFATDIHSKTLGEGKNDDSLARTGEIKGELVMVCATPIRPLRWNCNPA